MATTIDLVKDSTLQSINEKLDVQNTYLALIAKKEGEVKLDDWKSVQSIVRAGLHSRIFSIGDQFVCKKISNLKTENSVVVISSNLTVDKMTFLSKMTKLKEDGYYFEFYNSCWNFEEETVELTDYGIKLNGTPKEGDYIKVIPFVSEVVLDIIGFDVDIPADHAYRHSMTLMCHNVYRRSMFDSPQALYYASEGLDAGTYNFTIPEISNLSSDDSGTYQFTLTKAIPIGGQIFISWQTGVSILDALITTYSDCESDTPLESKIKVSQGNEGTSLGIADGNSTNINHFLYARYGGFDWETSEIRQWCNNTKAEGVWHMVNAFDRRPSWADNSLNFLNDLDPQLVSVIGAVEKNTAVIKQISEYDSNGGLVEKITSAGTKTTLDKVFILSEDEIYNENQNGVLEGTAYEYFQNLALSPIPYDTACEGRIKYLTSGTALSWWLRSPGQSNMGYGYMVYNDGRVGDYNASNTNQGVVPAFNIV